MLGWEFGDSENQTNFYGDWDMLKIIGICCYTGAEVVCFHWTRDADAGIARAKRDAKDFGQYHLTEFRAEAA